MAPNAQTGIKSFTLMNLVFAFYAITKQLLCHLIAMISIPLCMASSIRDSSSFSCESDGKNVVPNYFDKEGTSKVQKHRIPRQNSTPINS